MQVDIEPFKFPRSLLYLILAIVVIIISATFIFGFAIKLDSSSSSSSSLANGSCLPCLWENSYISDETAQEKLTEGIYPFAYFCPSGN